MGEEEIALVGEEERGTPKRGTRYGVLGGKGDLCGVELWEPCWAGLRVMARDQ